MAGNITAFPIPYTEDADLVARALAVGDAILAFDNAGLFATIDPAFIGVDNTPSKDDDAAGGTLDATSTERFGRYDITLGSLIVDLDDIPWFLFAPFATGNYDYSLTIRKLGGSVLRVTSADQLTLVARKTDGSYVVVEIS